MPASVITMDVREIKASSIVVEIERIGEEMLADTHRAFVRQGRRMVAAVLASAALVFVICLLVNG